jgi:signal transduction histidine kinase
MVGRDGHDNPMTMVAQIPAGTRAGPASGPPIYVLAVIALAGCVLAVFSITLAIREGVPDIQIALLEWISLPYIAAGLIAWWRRPESRLGPLMILGGFATGLLALQFTDIQALQTFGAALDIVPVAVFLHVSLAFPSGHLRSRAERVLVSAAYAVAIGLQIAKMTLGGYGPDNLLAIASRPDGAQIVERVQLLSMSAFCLIGVGLLVARRRYAGRPRQPWLARLVESFALGLVMVAVLYVDGAFDGPAFVPFQRATLAVIGIAPIVFLLGLLDARLARSGVGDLMIQLRGNPSPSDLRGALARAVRDPSLELVYWLPEFGCYADVDGREVALPDHDDRRAMTPIGRDGARVAALIHDPSLADERELLDAVTAAAGIALENARLQVELRARLEELRGSRARIVEVAQEERKRLERNLHDGAQQRLVALSLELGLLGEQLDAAGPARVRLEQARGEIAQSLAELREIARGLHPAVVSAHGLEVALEQLVALSPVPVALVVQVDGRLPEPVEVAAYYLVCESLANVGKYAKASSARVEVLRQGDRVLVEVADDGVGGADTERGSGLRGLADRVEALGGRLRVWSPTGGGTRVSAELPCAS